MTIRKKIKTGSISPLLPDVIPARRLKTKVTPKTKAGVSKTKVINGKDKYRKEPNDMPDIVALAGAGKPGPVELKVEKIVARQALKAPPQWPFPQEEESNVKVLKFEAGISRSLNGPRDGPAATFHLVDEASGASIEIPLTTQQLGAMVAGGTIGTVEVTMFNLSKLGRKRERKTIKVYTNKLGYGDRDAKVKALGEAKCPDGWTFVGPGLNGSSWSQSDTGYDNERKKHWIKLHYMRWV